MKEPTIFELSKVKVPENFAELILKDKKEFFRKAIGDTIFRYDNTLFLFEENRVIIFKEVKTNGPST